MKSEYDVNLSSDKINEINRTLSKTERLMRDNIREALERGKKINSLEKKTNKINENAYYTWSLASKIKENAVNNDYKQMAIIIGAAVGGLTAAVTGFSFPAVVLASGLGSVAGFVLNKIREKIMGYFYVNLVEPDSPDNISQNPPVDAMQNNDFAPSTLKPSPFDSHRRIPSKPRSRCSSPALVKNINSGNNRKKMRN